jgi:hypothetical protein
MSRFLNVRRNAKPVTDWPACFGVFLDNEAGRESPSGVHRAAPRAPPGERPAPYHAIWHPKVGERKR